jgi:hypothetical protein
MKMLSFIQFITESNQPFDINQFIGSAISGSKIGNKISGPSNKESEHKKGSLAQFAAAAQIISDRLHDSEHSSLNPEHHEQVKKHVFDTLHAHFHPVTGQHRTNDFEFTVKTPEGTPRWSVTVGNPNRTDRSSAGIKRDDIFIKSLHSDKPYEEYIDVKTDRANLADRTVRGIFGGRASHKDPRTSRFFTSYWHVSHTRRNKKIRCIIPIKKSDNKKIRTSKKIKRNNIICFG